ncbi:MAG: cytochrome C [Deltaproteobacteria bacterium]|nr:cytochrome C [Deltaproteobacteria bacterium]
MNIPSLAFAFLLAFCFTAAPGLCADKKTVKIDGKKEFEKHCAVCHPNGGNIINPQKPLTAKSLKAHKFAEVKDIVSAMRKPGPGMTPFDQKAIPDKTAVAIAEYIVKTFK